MKRLTFFAFYFGIASIVLHLYMLVKSVFFVDVFTMIWAAGSLCLITTIIAIADIFEKPRRQMFNFIDKYLK